MATTLTAADPAKTAAETVAIAQTALTAVMALDAHLGAIQGSGSTYGDTDHGRAMLRAYFALTDALAEAGLLLTD